MALVYRSLFSDADGEIASQLSAQFEQWLSSKDFAVPEGGLAGRGQALDSPNNDVAWASELRNDLPSGDRMHRLRLVEETAQGRWATSVAAIAPPVDQGGRPRIWVEVEHEPAPGAPPRRPGSPRLVRELLATGEGYDGPVPLTSEAWMVHAGLVDELVTWITSTARSVPVIVFAYDSQRAYDQERLAQQLARDLAGIAAVVRLADGDVTQRLASKLPDEYAVWGGAMRTYLPGSGSACDDTAARHRVLGRASLSALGPRAFPAVKDQILALSIERAAPVVGAGLHRGLRQTAGSAISAAPSQVPERALPSIGPGWLRERLSRMMRALGGDRQSTPTAAAEMLAQFDTTLDRLIDRAQERTQSAPQDEPRRHEQPEQTAELSRVLTELDREREDRRVLEQLLNESSEAASQQSALDEERRAENDELTLEVTESAEEVDRLERRVRYLQQRVRELGDAGVGADDSLPTAPPSVADTVVSAREHLDFVHIAPDVDAVAAELDLHARSQLFAVKAWSALCALNAYGRARSSGDFQGSFYSWCSEPPPGEQAISAGAVAMTESETVETDPALRNARLFAVPTAVSTAGTAFMPAHIKLVKRGTPAPRLHFLDDVAGSGKVYVGYLGAHLPTAKFA